MSDPDRRALAAITRTLTQAADADPTWTAHAILTTLRGQGWRPTNAQPPAEWRQPHAQPCEPTTEYLAARPPSKATT